MKKFADILFKCIEDELKCEMGEFTYFKFMEYRLHGLTKSFAVYIHHKIN